MLQGPPANADSPLAAIVDSPMVDSPLPLLPPPPPLLPPPPPPPPVAAAGRFFTGDWRRRFSMGFMVVAAAGRFLLPLAIGSGDGGSNSLTGEGDGATGATPRAGHRPPLQDWWQPGKQPEHLD